jgi:hypothetical protein
MLKPTSSYKMSAAHKNTLLKYKDPHIRGLIKRSLIQADLEASIKPKADKTSKKNSMDDLDL